MMTAAGELASFLPFAFCDKGMIRQALNVQCWLCKDLCHTVENR